MHAVLEGTALEIARLLDGVDARSSGLHPDGNGHRWSIQQVIEHLALTSQFTAKVLEARLAKGRITRRQERTALQRVLQLMVLSFAYLPQGAPDLEETIPAEGIFAPMTGWELGRLLHREMDAMDIVLDRCRRKFGMERVAVHPIYGPLRVDQWRRFHAVHTAYHLQQIQRLRKLVVPEMLPERSPRVVLAKELRVPAQRPFA